jgi:hypothetical protein
MVECIHVRPVSEVWLCGEALLSLGGFHLVVLAPYVYSWLRFAFV